MEVLKSLEFYLSAEDFAEFMALVGFEIDGVTEEHSLAQNFPNPFNTETSIQYSVARDLFSTHVTLIIYNPLGQKIMTLVDAVKEPGNYAVTWDGKESNGGEAASGVYFYRLTVGETSREYPGDLTVTKRMVLMK